MAADLIETQTLSTRGTSLARVMSLQQDYFSSGRTAEYGFRKEQLRRFHDNFLRFEEDLALAVKKDIGKPYREAYTMELALIAKEIRYFQKNMAKLMKVKRVATPLFLFPARSYRQPVPLGQVLILSPWNYPYLLTLIPLVGAIAAGNCVVIKPSEVGSYSSQVMADLIHESFDEEYVSSFLGGPGLSQELLTHPWGHVFFTGSTSVGREVAGACAKTLSPVTLELGGKSPAIVSATANIALAARRIIFGKLSNVGQTCVAPDYLLVQSSIAEPLIAALKDELQRQLGVDLENNSGYGRIINESHFDRLVAMMKGGDIIYGGRHDRQDLFMEPTLLTNIPPESPLFNREIFGPLLPIFTFHKFEEAMEFVNKKTKPLAAYIFSEDKLEINRFKREIPFGGGCVNDTIIHLSNNELPFGGVGHSGIGSYHGKYSFDTFSHYKSIVHVSSRLDLPFRYLPETPIKNKVMRFFIR